MDKLLVLRIYDTMNEFVNTTDKMTIHRKDFMAVARQVAEMEAIQEQPTLPEVIDWEKRYYQLERLIKADHPEFELPEYPIKPPKPKGDIPMA